MKEDIARVQSSAGNHSIGKRKGFRFGVVALLLLIIAFAAVQLLGHHSPTIDILGSYFPSWMICIASGMTLTLVAHWIIQARNWKDYVGPGPLIYPCLWLIFTFATWILFYQN